MTNLIDLTMYSDDYAEFKLNEAIRLRLPYKTSLFRNKPWGYERTDTGTFYPLSEMSAVLVRAAQLRAEGYSMDEIVEWTQKTPHPIPRRTLYYLWEHTWPFPEAKYDERTLRQYIEGVTVAGDADIGSEIDPEGAEGTERSE